MSRSGEARAFECRRRSTSHDHLTHARCLEILHTVASHARPASGRRIRARGPWLVWRVKLGWAESGKQSAQPGMLHDWAVIEL